MAETDSGFSELQDGDFPLRYVYRCLPVSTSSCSYRFPVNFPFSRRFSYGFHLIFPLSCGLSYGYPLIFSIFLWVFLWILSIFPWFLYGFSMVVPWFSVLEPPCRGPFCAVRACMSLRAVVRPLELAGQSTCKPSAVENDHRNYGHL